MSLARSCCRLVLPACVLAVPLLSVCAGGSPDSSTNLLANDRFEQLDSRGAPLFWEAACDPGSIERTIALSESPVYVTGPASMSVEEFLEKVRVGE